MSIPKKAIHNLTCMETIEKESEYSERTLKNQQFDTRLIEHIVRLAEQGIPRRELVKTYGMHSHTLGKWILSRSSVIQKRRRYSTAEKRSVVRAVSAGMTVREAVIAFNVPTSTMVRRWIKDFSLENTEISIPKPIEMPKNPILESDNAEIKALRKALEEANMKNRALNTLIDIAEEQLKIEIRKKPGARQSPK
jgi:transposase